MKVLQMPRFKKYVKKLPRHLQQVILDAVEDVLSDTLYFTRLVHMKTFIRI